MGNVTALLVCSVLLLYLHGVASAQHRPHKPNSGQEIRSSSYRNAVTMDIPQITGIGGLAFFTGGAQYERFLSEDGRLSLSIPFYAGVAPHITLYGNRQGDDYQQGKVFFMAPGLRYHPFGNRGRADFSLGLLAASGNLVITDYTVGNHGSRSTATNNYLFVAPMMQVDLNLHPFHQGIIGFHLSFGPSIGTDEVDLAIRFGARFGGRF